MDMVIICDISAWQYWATPPILREGSAFFGGLPSSGDAIVSQGGLPTRGNARAADRMIAYRSHSDLIGVSRPVHAMVGEHSGRRQNANVLAHRLGKDLEPFELDDLGGGLRMLGIEASLRYLAIALPTAELALKIMEASGTYATPKPTEELVALRDALIKAGPLSKKEQSKRASHIREFRDASGAVVSFHGSDGLPIPWELCFDTADRPQNLWRRPPLTSVEALETYTANAKGKRGTAQLRKALALCADGSASPLESKLFLLLYADIWTGGEGWPRPVLNQRIDFDEKARLLSDRTYAVADLLWKEQQVCIEVNGKGFHADKQGFTIESGRTAALESMGYRVLNINYDQMRDFDQLETILETFADALGFPLQRRTASFIKRKKAWHQAIFCD